MNYTDFFEQVKGKKIKWGNWQKTIFLYFIPERQQNQYMRGVTVCEGGKRIENDAFFISQGFNGIYPLCWELVSEQAEYIPISQKLCTCGAKHTSNPTFHLNWCDIK